METKNDKLGALVIGATGKLGSLITKHCLQKPNLQVSIFIRNPEKDPELVNQVEKAGGKVIKGDLSQPETIKGCTKGMHTVISVVSHMSTQVRLDGQIALVKDCMENGVSRFVPTDFAGDFTKFSDEELARSLVAETKVKLRKYLETVPIKTLHFWPGFFMETFFDAQHHGFSYWDHDDQRYDLTSYEDTAKVVASAVSNPDKTGDIYFVGDDLSIREVNEIYNKVRGTTNIKQKRLGSLDDLKKKHDEIKNNESDFFFAHALGLFSMMYDDRSKFHSNNNADFPDIKFTTFEEFLKQNPDVKVPEDVVKTLNIS